MSLDVIFLEQRQSNELLLNTDTDTALQKKQLSKTRKKKSTKLEGNITETKHNYLPIEQKIRLAKPFKKKYNKYI